MDINDIFVKEDVQEVWLDYREQKIGPIKVRSLSWSRKNQILTNCFTYGQDGQMKFNFDKYMKDMLSEIIIEAPWGKTDQIFLSRIKPDFGTTLEKLVPKAFEEIANADFFARE
jgi:hypothetical protein